jgi:hypothetical protein
MYVISLRNVRNLNRFIIGDNEFKVITSIQGILVPFIVNKSNYL